ncbi:MAG: hypothetical protein IKS08_01320, partial [Alphaproteobacteria bacterium]|nr:hypothetical protein [Alphaproteobacteria bacterium]
MLFSKNFRVLSIFALIAAAPHAVLAATPAGDSTITSKRYVDNKIPADSTAHLLVTPQASGGNATKRAITTAGTGITGLENANSTGATNIPTALAVKEAITSATSGMITDVSGKQDKDNNQIYKVGYNGGWENAYNAIGVDTTYLK